MAIAIGLVTGQLTLFVTCSLLASVRTDISIRGIGDITSLLGKSICTLVLTTCWWCPGKVVLCTHFWASSFTAKKVIFRVSHSLKKNIMLYQVRNIVQIQKGNFTLNQQTKSNL